jgi:hypothetical protein
VKEIKQMSLSPLKCSLSVSLKAGGVDEVIANFRVRARGNNSVPGRSSSTIRSNELPPFSGLKSKPSNPLLTVTIFLFAWLTLQP